MLKRVRGVVTSYYISIMIITMVFPLPTSLILFYQKNKFSFLYIKIYYHANVFYNSNVVA